MDLAQRLEDATKRRDTLAAQKQRTQGQLEAAQANLSAVEAEIKKRNITPEQLPEARAKLETRYEELVEQIERDVGAGEKAIAPFVKEI